MVSLHVGNRSAFSCDGFSAAVILEKVQGPFLRVPSGTAAYAKKVMIKDICTV